MKPVAAGMFGRGLFPVFFSGDDGLLRIVIKCDEPTWVGKHEQIVMSEVREMEELLTIGLNPKTGVT